MKKIFVLLYLITALLVVAGCKTTTESTTVEQSTTTELTTAISTIGSTTGIDPRIFNVSVYTTTGNKSKLLAQLADLELKQDDGTYIPTTLTIDESTVFQQIDGFGAALTESSAYLINSLEETKRNQVINDLFSSDGISMSFVRLPMGASDFALNNYSYNDLPAGSVDMDLSKFSIERDRQHVIPVLKDAFTLNPNIKLIGSPWSAPAWMKTNGSLNAGSLKDEYIDVYGNYFVKFIEEYEKENLPIYALTLQNEPLHETSSYPSMKMSALQQIKLIKNLGPKLETANLETKLIAYDHNWDERNYTYTVFNDVIASKYVAGTAFHCYAGEVGSQAIVQRAFPDKGIWFTECSGGAWANDFASNISWNMENVFIGSINNYSKSVLLWNIALDENYGPKNGGCSNCRGVVTIKSDGTIIKNEEYYTIGHFSKFVTPGAYRIGTELVGNTSILTTAFKNPNGDLVVVMHNKGSVESRIKINYDGLSTIYSLPGKTTSTLVIEKH